MRSLYESILDTDTQAQSDTLDKPLQELVEFLMLDDPREATCKYEIRNGKLYVNGIRGRERTFIFISVAGKVTNMKMNSSDKRIIDVNLLNLIYFEGVKIHCEVLELLNFLANCNNCIITYKGLRKEAYQGLDKVLSKTKGNTINIWSTEEEARFLFDYSCVSGLNLGNCRVVLYNSADLSTIKNLTARELIIQRGGKFEKDGPIFEADRELSDYFVQKLDEFLARNKIYSFGMVDSFVQFIDWFVKKGNDYTYEFLSSNKKRVPKVK